MTKDLPIGLFDSGIGGLSVWKEINRILPAESTIYLADNKNAPYGEKKHEDIIRLSKKNTEFLLKQNCKIIVVACNTATTNAIKTLRASYSIPFVGLEPPVKSAFAKTKTGKIGVLATQGTLSSDRFATTTNTYGKNIHIYQQVGKNLVSYIENGELYSHKTRKLLDKYLSPMVENGIDCLVLGCTHYPFLIPILKELLPKHIRIIDSGEPVANQVKRILAKRNLLQENTSPVFHHFHCNENKEVLSYFLKQTAPNIPYTLNVSDF